MLHSLGAGSQFVQSFSSFSLSFQVPSFNISRVSPDTVRADLAHGGGARSTVRRVKVTVGGLASLLQRIGRGAGRQRLHIFQAVISFGCSNLWRQAYLGYSGRVGRRRGSSLTQYGWWSSQHGSLYTGDRNQPPQQSFLGGTQRAEAGSGGGASRYEWGGQGQTTISRHTGATCCGLRSRASVSVTPISRQQCYPFWACNWTCQAGSSAATSGSCSALQRVDWAGDAFEAHNPYLRARDHVAVRQSPVSGRLHRRGWSVLERRIECVARPAFIDSREKHGSQRFSLTPGRLPGETLTPGRNTGVSGARESVGNQRSS